MQRHISLKPQQPSLQASSLWDETLLSEVEVVCPRNASWNTVEQQPLPVYHALVLEFITGLSHRLLQLANTQPDLVALGFFLRPAAVKQALNSRKTAKVLMPLGMTFHLVPSNVPTVSFYSWLAALLQGNSAVVRLSSRINAVQEAMLALLDQMLNEPQWQMIANRTRFIRYPHNNAITEYLSSRCAVRVIWGGDATIREIRQIPLSPKAKELCFPDRKSVAVLETNYLHSLNFTDFSRLIQRLGQDISQFNQQACASPVLLVWLGEPTSELWQRFWTALSHQFSDEFADKLEQTINLQLASCDGVIEQTEVFGKLVIGATSHAANVNRCQFGSGVLAYQIVESCDVWVSQQASFQTCVYVGADKASFAEKVKNSMAMRMDRICSAGQALAFDWSWDGEDLLQSYSRCIRY